MTTSTTHTQALIEAALDLARRCDGAPLGHAIAAPRDPRRPDELASNVSVEHALDRAANLLRHAAEELQDERMLRLGWGPA